MNRVVLQTHRRQFGQELISQPVVVQKPEASGWMIDLQQLVEFVTNPLGRHDL